MDALPKIKHYTKGQPGYPKQERFFDTLDDAAEKVGLKRISEPNTNPIVFSSKSTIVYYYHSTDLLHPHRLPEDLRGKMRTSTCVYFSGFSYANLWELTDAQMVLFDQNTFYEDEIELWQEQGISVTLCNLLE